MPGHQPHIPSPERRTTAAACFRSAAVSPTDRRRRAVDDRSPLGAGADGEGASGGVRRVGRHRAETPWRDAVAGCHQLPAKGRLGRNRRFPAGAARIMGTVPIFVSTKMGLSPSTAERYQLTEVRHAWVPCPRLPWACWVGPRFTCPRQAWAWHPAEQGGLSQFSCQRKWDCPLRRPKDTN